MHSKFGTLIDFGNRLLFVAHFFTQVVELLAFFCAMHMRRDELTDVDRTV